METTVVLVVPGGGQLPDCTLPAFVRARFDAALDAYFRNEAAGQESRIIALSNGTTHKVTARGCVAARPPAVAPPLVAQHTGCRVSCYRCFHL
jgi:hypothetical protein